MPRGMPYPAKAPNLPRTRTRAVVGSLDLGVAGAITCDDLAPHLYSGAVSWSVWARIDGTSGSPRMIFAINTAGKANILLHRLAGGASNGTFFGTVSPVTGTTHQTTSCVDDVWHHHAVSWDVGGDDKIRYYLDGVLQFTSVAYTAGTLSDDDLWTVGAEYDPGNPLADFLDGKIGPVAFFDRAITQNEVTTLYNGGAPGDARWVGCCAEYLPGSSGVHLLPTVLERSGALRVNASSVGVTSGDITTDHP